MGVVRMPELDYEILYKLPSLIKTWLKLKQEIDQDKTEDTYKQNVYQP